MPNYKNMCVCTYLMFVTFMLTLKMVEPSFPMALYDAIYVPKTSDSVFFSPINLKATLAVATLAAKGKTQEELLRSDDSTENGLKNDLLLPENTKHFIQDRQIYVGKGMIDDSFKKQLSPAYSFENVVFGPRNSTKKINYRVKDVTRRWVEDILPNSLNRNTAMAAVNSLYFHSDWKKEFTSTVTRGFKKSMLHQYGNFMFSNLSDLNAAVLQMEFKDNDAKLLVLQPNDNNLQRLGDQLLNVDLTKLPKRLNKTYMSLYFPIIKEIKMSVSLKDALSTLSVDRAFSDKANFGKIMDACEEDTGVFLKEVRQHTSFKSGRESARFVSVTGLQMDLSRATRAACSCLPDEYSTQLADEREGSEGIDLSLRKKDAPHHYFDSELFFALVNKKDVMFIGTLARNNRR